MNANILFAGTPEFAATLCERLLDTPFRPVAMLCQPDRRAGRGRKLQLSPVKALAQSAGIKVLQPQTLRGAEGETTQLELQALQPDLMIVAAYGLILPKAVLALPKRGCLNVHASLLPRWRGAAPIERAIMAGDQHTGVCLMDMDEGLDTGPVYAQRSLPIGDAATGRSLEAELAQLGGDMLLEFLPEILSGTLHALPQAEVGTCYAKKLVAKDARIDWRASSAEILRQIRALTDRITAWTEVRETTGNNTGQPVRLNILAADPGQSPDERPDEDTPQQTNEQMAPGAIISSNKKGVDVQCGEGVIRLKTVQLNKGKGRVMSISEARNGNQQLFQVGTVFEPSDSAAVDDAIR